MFAAKYGNVDVAKILLEAKADVTLQDRYGDTAVSRAGDEKDIDMLLLFGQKKNNIV